MSDRSSELKGLSFAQERLWFLDQMRPGDSAYNLYVALRLEGPLDLASLENALEAVVARHEALRTTFPTVDGEPALAVAPPATFEWSRTDLLTVPEVERDARVRARVLEETARPFDLASGPLLRASILRVADREHVFVLTIHHVVCDGWSLDLLLAEIGDRYARLARGERPVLTVPPLAYSAFAREERERFERGELEPARAYWRQQLTPLPPPLELPRDPDARGAEGGAFAIGFELPERLGRSLRQLSRSERTTRFAVVLATLQTLLGRWTGQDDVCVGTPVAGRTRPDLEDVVGLFANTLVLRADLAGDPTFRELLRRTRERVLDATEHQEMPFDRLVAELGPGRDLRRTPLFSVSLAFQNLPDSGFELPGLTVTPMEIAPAAAKFDLSLEIAERGDAMSGSLECRADLFGPATAESFVAQLQRLLEAVAADPDRALSGLPLLREEEREEVLERWNGGGGEGWGRLDEGFEAQARETPKRVAVSCGAEHLSYEELWRRARRVAGRLRAVGVGRETVVGVCAERSLELVVGLVGVVMAGGAYVPLDPRYPEERLRYLVEDSAAAVVLVGRGLRGRVSGAQVEEIAEAEGWSEEAERVAGGSAEDAAYVMYTSGSTGKPKGVVVSHGNVARLFTATREEFGFGSADVWTLFHSSAFDFSVWELWGALLHGGRVVVVPYEVSRSPEGFLELVEREGVTVLNQTPSAFRQLMRVDEERGGVELPRLRWVIFGGEALEPRTLRGWFARHGEEQPGLVNMYGITETTVHVTWRRLRSEDARRSGSGSPIGRPLADLRVYVLDGARQPVPVGVAGELWVGGAGVARGYWRREELTAERFVADPFVGRAGARMYRSGDRGRWVSGGELEYLGRVDEQVKVRGFRVELAEIEAALLEHEGVRECVVVARGEGGEERQLVGYVVSEEGRRPSVSGLRAHLKERLPEHMVPAAVMMLEALPLTAHGKVDRRALPAPEGTRPELTVAYEPPQGALEERLAEVWRQVLGLDRVGRHDNFFDLGGDSIRATQMVARVRASMGVQVDVGACFDAPTFSSFADRIEAAGADGFVLPPIGARGQGPVPLSSPQRRLWFLDRLDPGTATYNVPLGLRLEGWLDRAALARAFEEVQRRHESLRTTFDIVNGEPVQVVSPSCAPLEWDDLRSLPLEEREPAALRIAAREARTPFELNRGPLTRARLVHLAEDRHLLVLCFHHIVIDGWSLDLFVRELSILYVAGSTSPLPAPRLQYGDYSAWQRQALAADTLREARAYWMRELQGAPGLELPIDRPRPTRPSHAGARAPVRLDSDLVDALGARSREYGTTLFTTLLAAFHVLLHRWSGQDDVCVGTPVAGRSRVELEDLIGFFANTLVIRADLSGDPTFAELVARIHDKVLAAHRHQDVPFETVVEDIHPGRDPSRQPLFQAMLAFQGSTTSIPELPGLRVTALDVDPGASKFDLTLSLAMGEGDVAGMIEYATELFDPDSMRRFATHYIRLLRAITDDPARRVSELPLDMEAERSQVLEIWSGAEAAAAMEPVPRPLLEEMWRRAQERPDAIAVSGEEEALPYRALKARAGQVAARLRTLGLRRGTAVGLCLERSPEAIVGILGILESGGAYVPIEPSWPPERIALVQREARIRLTLTKEHWLDRLPADSPTLCLESFYPWSCAGEASESTERSDERADDLAYVLFTSGSTGTPKGVRVSRGNLHHSTRARSLYYHEPVSSFVLVPPLVFDSSVAGIFWTLVEGGELVVAPEGFVQDLRALGRLVARRRATHWLGIPALYDALLDQAEAEDLASLRTVIVAGEICPPDLVRRHRQRLPHARLFNEYGPTEATVWSTVFDASEGTRRARVPIGRPIPGARVYVLDRRARPVPIGLPGELCVAGPGVALGDLGSDDGSRRFVPDPFGLPGDRLYRTGDRVRWLSEGDLEFLGRLDGQVKVRGVRIDPAEIEAALTELPDLEEGIVIARPIADHESSLIAFAVARAGAEPTCESVRARLAERLPSVMVPSTVVFVDRLPRTPGGKPDRAALASRPLPTVTARRAPGDEIEIRVAAIWREVLRIDDVGVNESFLDRGGHSLLAVKLVARIDEAFGTRLSLSRFLQDDTIAGVASALRARVAGAPEPRTVAPARPTIVTLQSHGAKPPLFLFHPLGGTVVCYRDLARRLGVERPIFGLGSAGLEADGWMADSIEAIGDEYADALRQAWPSGPYLLGGWSFGGWLAFRAARALRRHAEAVLVLLDTRVESIASEPPESGHDLASLIAAEWGDRAETRVDHEAFGRFEDVVRRHRAALARHRPTPSSGPTLLIRAVGAEPSGPHDWETLVHEGLEVRDVAVDHFDLLREPAVRNVAESLRAWFRRFEEPVETEREARAEGVASLTESAE